MKQHKKPEKQEQPYMTTTKINLYKMNVRPKISYAGPAQGAQLSASNWNKIEAIQNVSIRTITGLPWYGQNTTIANSIQMITIKK